MSTRRNVWHAVAVTSGIDVVPIGHLFAKRIGGRIATKPGAEVPPSFDEILSKLAELDESCMIS